jgi:hypothetical protein
VTLVTVFVSRANYASPMNSTRRTFLEISAVATAALATPHLGSGAASANRVANAVPPKPPFPVIDYHVHLSPGLTIDRALALGKERGVSLGILEHPGPGYPINTDADLRRYIDSLRPHPVKIGLQPVYPGWSKSFSKSLLGELDYVLMDALTLPLPETGGWLPIWQIDTMVDDGEQFIDGYMHFIEQVLTTEPIDIFGWPTFLPVPIARQYEQLWTKPRRQHIIDLARARKIAIEINEVSHVPDEAFIREAKRAGLKFTFGTDSRNDHATHFYYAYQMAQKCGLTEADMFSPKKR